MATYHVKVRETLAYLLEVEAPTPKAAVDKAAAHVRGGPGRATGVRQIERESEETTVEWCEPA